MIIETGLYSRLKQLSQQENISISKVIELSITTSINTSQENNTNNQKEHLENKLNSNSISQTGFSVNAFPKNVSSLDSLSASIYSWTFKDLRLAKDYSYRFGVLNTQD